MQGLVILRWGLRRHRSLTHEPFCRLHMLFSKRVPHFVRAGPVHILTLTPLPSVIPSQVAAYISSLSTPLPSVILSKVAT